MKAPFLKRLLSYIIDMIIVSIIISVICMALPNNNKETEKKFEELSTKLASNEIKPDKYLSEYKDLVYENNKNTVLEIGVNLAITIAYFVIFQYMNKGQTLGKKLLKIRVVDKDTKKEISILKGLLRSIIILNLISSLVSIVLIKLISKNAYMNIYLTINEIEVFFIFVTAILILYRNDGRGLHDMMANTMVIAEER